MISNGAIALFVLAGLFVLLTTRTHRTTDAIASSIAALLCVAIATYLEVGQ